MNAIITKNNRYPLLLLSVGVLWFLLFYVLADMAGQTFIFPDADNYRESAEMLYHQGKSHYFRPLLMAAITGIPYLFGLGDKAVYQFSLFVNLIAWLVTAQLLYRMLLKYLDMKKAFWVSLLFYGLIGSLFIAYHLLTETIFTLVMLLVFYLIEKYRATSKYLYLSGGLALALLSVLIRPGAKFIAILFVLWFIRQIIRNLFRPASVLIGLAVGALLLQCALVQRDYGNFTISYIDGLTYYNYIGSKAIFYKEGKKFEQDTNPRARYLSTLSFPEQKRVTFADLKEQLANNKVNLIRAGLDDLEGNIFSGSSAVALLQDSRNNPAFFKLKCRILYNVARLQNILLTFAGFFLSLYFIFKRFRKDIPAVLMGLYIIYNIFIPALSFNQGDRFHLIFYPVVLLLAAKLYSQKQKRA